MMIPFVGKTSNSPFEWDTIFRESEAHIDQLELSFIDPLLMDPLEAGDEVRDEALGLVIEHLHRPRLWP